MKAFLPDCLLEGVFQPVTTNIRTLIFAAAAAFVALGSSSAVASAQTAAATRPVAPATNAAATAAGNPNAPDKIGVVYTDQFLAQQGGITRLTAAASALEREFKPRTDELQASQKTLQDLVTKIQSTQNVADQAAIARDRERAEQLDVEIKRKTEDLQRAYQRRQGELLAPLSDNINQALQTFAASRGITLLFDGAKLPGVMIPLNKSMDITDAFIADYNSKNPGGTASAAPAATTRRP